MTISTSDYGVDAVECASSAKPEEELEWLPNPYQALADAQVLAGAWPGSPMLMTGTPVIIGAAHGLGGAPQTMEVHAQGWVSSEIVIDDSSCWAVQSGDDDSYWGSSVPSCRELSAAPWNVLHDYSNSSLAESCETRVPSYQDDQCESFENSSGRNTPVEPLEGDDMSAAGGRSAMGHYPRKLSHRCVPKGTDLGERFNEKTDREEITTLMIRNIPNMYTRSMLVEELGSLDFGGEYDFLYLPIDKSTQWNVGYAFVNFKTPEAARRCMKTMANYVFCCYDHGSGKVTQISPAHMQGLERNLAYYSNTAVQCAGNQTNRPLVLSAGRQDASEAPRRPHRRRRRARAANSLAAVI